MTETGSRSAERALLLAAPTVRGAYGIEVVRLGARRAP